jgi:hypothetical protein
MIINLFVSVTLMSHSFVSNVWRQNILRVNATFESLRITKAPILAISYKLSTYYTLWHLDYIPKGAEPK